MFYFSQPFGDVNQAQNQGNTDEIIRTSRWRIARKLSIRKFCLC
ncbi:hypothetical protein VCR15J2_80079 [Vibrio coralliirubri]|uniref:Uncharacterized protein n=1 Tax=Vibrio coralliirubri TaxID=1516159 RepID=A0AA87BZ01_9VIBR|nr:hypothetical protein VCR31J2_120062 [Vibrio coralliirubri]CDT56578.1 hypothetical protein VCR26J2_20062 [Vibrio coralliirubri]CDT80176.1 hypothetical protein VCR8J2_20017 [Vibrio coralliirubri]CDT83835.1 hypothetical protein VCR15J2_80079 [Vibrio coralliirubri]CDT93279.1 hypothetical protein VCR29J2_970017 [Vibrio coralliirubri]